MQFPRSLSAQSNAAASPARTLQLHTALLWSAGAPAMTEIRELVRFFVERLESASADYLIVGAVAYFA